MATQSFVTRHSLLSQVFRHTSYINEQLFCLNIESLNMECLNIECLNIECLNTECLNIECWFPISIRSWELLIRVLTKTLFSLPRTPQQIHSVHCQTSGAEHPYFCYTWHKCLKSFGPHIFAEFLTNVVLDPSLTSTHSANVMLQPNRRPACYAQTELVEEWEMASLLFF